MSQIQNSTEFINAMKSQGFYVVHAALSADDIEKLLNLAEERFERGFFEPACIGKGLAKKRVRDIRGDLISWIIDWSPQALSQFETVLQEMLLICKREFFVPIKRFESHFSFYPPGTFYKKHVDRHRTKPHRCFTCVLYLSDWQPGAGGELIIHREDQPPFIVEPRSGTMVFFDSELEHEVKKTEQPRWSLTSWLRDDEIPIPL